MPLITRDSLMTLEAYAKARPQFRAEVMAHKKNRSLQIGGNVSLIFEDEITIRYQVQEMLRIEKIFEEAGIADELDTYNPLIPNGSNWKATMLIEYPDPRQRQNMLSRLIGIEDKVWVRIDGCQRVYAIADEDLERENAEKTSSVHFLRFELDSHMVKLIRGGANFAVGIDHQQYNFTIDSVDARIRNSLVADLI
jgi:hypothetical protein